MKSDNNQNQYVAKLRAVIGQMLRPIKEVPFDLVIESLSGCRVIPFDPKKPKDVAVLKTLESVARTVGSAVNVHGIKRSRPNEVGNDIEDFVLAALNENGYKSRRPLTDSGKKKNQGYPDLQFIDQEGRLSYLECKTYNIGNLASSQRSFYLSPSDEFKVTKDAHHFVLSFEVFVERRSGISNIYKCKSWKIIDVANLLVDIKYEFNADNVRLYSADVVLSEGSLQ